MTQVELAASIGVSFQQVQKYEQGIAAIADRRLQQICEVLELPANFFSGPSDFIGRAAQPDQPERRTNTLAQYTRSERAFLNSEEGMHFVKALTSITDAKLRARIVEFIAELATNY